MKNKFKYVPLLLAFIAFGCEKLDEQPISSVTPDNFCKSAFQVESAYAAAMNYLWDYWGGYGYFHDAIRNDDQIDGGNLDIPEDIGDDLWRIHYAALLNINKALEAIKKGNLKSESEETVNALVAEGKFLRAHNYFMLVRFFGGVPLLTEDSPDPVSNPMPRASVQEVYDLIESDLQFAAEHLPAAWDGAPGKPTSGAAKAMLAKAYLTMATYPLNKPENYAKAAQVAMEVIQSGQYSLVPDVYKVFSLENKYGPEMIWSYNSTYDDIATDPQIWTTEIYLDGGWGDCGLDTAFERSWPAQPRKDAYVLTDWDGVHYTDFPEQVPFCKKFFFYISEDDFNGYSSTMNWPVLRYADVLLIYAEAANMANGGPTQAAVDAVNEVIDRANGYVDNPDHPKLTLSMSKDEFDAAVIQERSWELCLENADRWFDICRKRILDKVSRPEYLVNFSVDDYLFPIPQTDLRLNPLLEQNPGYSRP